jgi:hypothetical protein
VNSNVKDESTIRILKKRIIDSFLRSDNRNETDICNMNKLIQNEKDKKLQKMLSDTMKARKGKDNIDHHKQHVEY